MRNVIIFIILIFIFSVTDISSREPSDYYESLQKNPSEVGLGKTLSEISSPTSVISDHVGGQGRVSSSNSEISGKSGDVTITQIISHEDPIKVTKRISSINNRGYLVGDAIRISVELECSKEKLMNLYIREDIDRDLKILNFSNYCYKISSLQELFYYEEHKYFNCPLELCTFYTEDPENVSDINYYFDNRSYNISRKTMVPLNNLGRERYEIDSLKNESLLEICNDLNCMGPIIEVYEGVPFSKRSDKITIKTINGCIYDLMKFRIGNKTYISTLGNCLYIENINTINNTDKLLYWYYIIPKKAGIYKMETNLYAKKDEPVEKQDYHMKHELNLEVVEPEFRVEVSSQLKQVYKNEPITFVYYVKPMSYELESNYDNLIIKIDKEPQTYKVIGGIVNKSVDNYGINNEGRVNWTVKYINTGIYDKPGIAVIDEIHNTRRHYTFSSSDIHVDTPISRLNLPLILSLVLAAIGAISLDILIRPSKLGETKTSAKFIEILNSIIFIIMIIGVMSAIYIGLLQLRMYTTVLDYVPIMYLYNYHKYYVIFSFIIISVLIYKFGGPVRKLIIKIMKR